MKKLLIGFCAMALALTGFSQKLGHVDSAALLEAMPERAALEAEYQKHAEDLETYLTSLQTEFQALYADYQQNAATWPEPVLQAKQKELTDKESQIGQFQQTAAQELQVKEAELLQPLIDKAKKAIEDVGAENGYTYVFDSSIGVLLYQGGDDLLPLVKTKLGIAN
jgi:outer membrane protein